MRTVKARTVRGFLGASLLVGSIISATPALSQEGPVDLLSQYDIRLEGTAELDQTGYSVAAAGDVDDDGTRDLLVGAPYADSGADEDAGRAYVFFGDPLAHSVDLSSLGSLGFQIDGAMEGDQAGYSVAGAGDVNNDGLDDVVIGAPSADNIAGGSGSTYVVFGKTTTTAVDLGALGTSGFRVDGGTYAIQSGVSVGGARDVNNDGLMDIVIGAYLADMNGRSNSGSAYVVFGKATTTSVNLASLGAGGFEIDGAAPDDFAGFAVAGARDVNNDGKTDVIVGAYGADNNSLTNSGSAYVVFGKATTTTIDLASLGAAGFRIDGAIEQELAGYAVAGARDMNDDGLTDVVIGVPFATDQSRHLSGSAYVVFGKSSTSPISLSSLGAGGFRIDGAAEEERLGISASELGDVNADGVPDIVLGAYRAGNNSRATSGSAYVVFGKSSTDDLDLSSLEGSDGFRIDGATADDRMGISVSGIGDVNHDGLNDVAFGAPLADDNNRTDSGSAYIELVADWIPLACANPRSGTNGDDTLIGGYQGDNITGGDGDDVLKGVDGDDCVSGEAGADEMYGGEGADALTGGDQADTIEGNDGDDDLIGGAGADTLKAGDKQDTVEAGDGDDTVQGGAQADTLEGEDDKDTVSGGDGADTLKGSTGKDTLEGEDGDDTLKGGDKDDTLKGGDGKDSIESGDGDDTIKADDGKKDTIDCGSGIDDVDHDSKDVLISC